MPLRFSVLGATDRASRRAAAIARDPESSLVAVAGGPRAAALGVPERTAREAIEAADVVVLDDAGPRDVLAALVIDAGRHLVFEEGTDLAPAALERLLDRAARVGRAVHVSAPWGLGAAAETLRAHLRAGAREARLTDLRAVAALSDPPGGVEALVHRIIDVLGPVRAVQSRSQTGEALVAELVLDSGGAVTIVVRADPYSQPGVTFDVVDGSGGTWRERGGALWKDGRSQTLLQVRSLVELDHRRFVARLGAPLDAGGRARWLAAARIAADVQFGVGDDR
jgi:hypothetical protein